MATLTVWRFDTADGARTALATLQRLQKEELIQVLDAAIVSWPDGRRRPKTEQLHDLTRTGALAGAFWGLLFGLIFFVPLLGHVEEVADRGLRAQAAPGCVVGMPKYARYEGMPPPCQEPPGSRSPSTRTS